MKFRAWLLSLVTVVGAGLIPALAQDDQQQRQDPAQTRAADNQKEAQPASSQDQEQPGEPETAKNPEIKHDGGKNDVDAIGSRKVGGLNRYPIETDIKLGKMYAIEIESSMKMVTDPIVTEYVNRIGQNLARNSDAKVPITIKVIDDDSINAMALPGGPLYVNSGMILAADDEAELAGAMAHEIAHIALRHYTRTMTRADIVHILMLPIIVTGTPVPIVNVPGLVIPMTFLKFSRDFETEADYYGLQYMYKAGYDPNALVTMFEKIQAREKKKPGTIAKAFATHPQTPDRIQKSQKEMARILPRRDSYIETTSEFSEVKTRLALLENHSRVEDAKQDKPSLRRTPATDRDKKDDDRPVLKRLAAL